MALQKYNVSDGHIEPSSTGQWVKAAEAEAKIASLGEMNKALKKRISDLEDQVDNLKMEITETQQEPTASANSAGQFS